MISVCWKYSKYRLADRSPGVISGDLEDLLVVLQKAKEEMVTPSAVMHSNSAESDLPPSPEVPKHQISASSLPRPVMTAGPLRPKCLSMKLILRA